MTIKLTLTIPVAQNKTQNWVERDDAGATRRQLTGRNYKTGKNGGGVLLKYTFSLLIMVIAHESYSYESVTSSGIKIVSTNKQIIIKGDESLEVINLPKKAISRRCSGKGKYSAIIIRASTLYGVDADLVNAVISSESCFNPKAVSPKGAQGLMQLMPFTAKRFGVTNSFDPAQNISGGVKYLRFLLNRFKGDVQLAVAAYNAGEGAVDHYGVIPPYKETRHYVKKVMRLYGKDSQKDDGVFIAPLKHVDSNKCISSRKIRAFTYLKVSGAYLRRFYIRKKGDTYSSIAKNVGLSRKEIENLNSSNKVNSLSKKQLSHIILLWKCKLK